MGNQRNPQAGGPRVLISRAELPVTKQLMYSASASTHTAFDIPIGASLIGFFWPGHSTTFRVRFEAAPSASGVYSLIRLVDDSGFLTIHGTSASTAGRVMLPDMACFRFLRAVTSKTFGTKRIYGFIVKG